MSNFELDEILEGEEYKNYSGPVQLIFAEGKVEDTSGNKNVQTTITLDYDDGDDEDNPIIVDVVDPIWRYQTSSINRETQEVEIEIKGTDKYYKESNLTSDKIKVLVDNKEINTITKQIEKIGETGTSVEYRIKLGNFEENCGITKIRLAEGTIVDESENGNIETDIEVGNPEWVEEGDDSANPKYTAFRESIVDFVKPEIIYQTSSIDREKETVTVEMKLKERQYYNYELTEENIKVYVNDVEEPNIVKKITTEVKEEGNIKTTEYSLELSNMKEYYGKVSIEIAGNIIEDTSGYINEQKKMDIGNPEWVEEGDDSANPKYTAFRESIVDFIKPEITYTPKETNPIIDYENKTLSFEIEVQDQYLDFEKTKASEIDLNKVKVLVDGEDATTVQKEAELLEYSGIYAKYKIILSNFGSDTINEDNGYLDYSGKVEIGFEEGAIKDTSGNGNEITNIKIKDEENQDIIVDLVDPVWTYSTSSIDRETEEVEIEIMASDKYYKENTLTPDKIKVLLDGKENTTISKNLEKISENTVSAKKSI